MNQTPLRETPYSEVKAGVIHFCQLIGLKVTQDEELDIYVGFMIKQNSHMWIGAMETAFEDFTSGKYPDVKRPYQLSALFLGQVLQEFWKQRRTSGAIHTVYNDDEAPFNPLEYKKQMLMDYAEGLGQTRQSGYGFLVHERETDKIDDLDRLRFMYHEYMKTRGIDIGPYGGPYTEETREVDPNEFIEQRRPYEARGGESE